MNNKKASNNNSKNEYKQQSIKEMFQKFFILLNSNEKKEFLENFPEGYDDIFLTAYKSLDQGLTAEELEAALELSYLIKSIYLLIHKAESLSNGFNPLLAGILSNVKFSILLGEKPIRDLANLVGLFAINQAEALVEKIRQDDLVFDEDKEKICDSLEKELEILNEDKENFLGKVNEEYSKKSHKKLNKKQKEDSLSELIKLNSFTDNGN